MKMWKAWYVWWKGKKNEEEKRRRKKRKKERRKHAAHLKDLLAVGNQGIIVKVSPCCLDTLNRHCALNPKRQSGTLNDRTHAQAYPGQRPVLIIAWSTWRRPTWWRCLRSCRFFKFLILKQQAIDTQILSDLLQEHFPPFASVLAIVISWVSSTRWRSTNPIFLSSAVALSSSIVCRSRCLAANNGR